MEKLLEASLCSLVDLAEFTESVSLAVAFFHQLALMVRKFIEAATQMILGGGLACRGLHHIFHELFAEIRVGEEPLVAFFIAQMRQHLKARYAESKGSEIRAFLKVRLFGT